jgi:hypothetical protein
MYAECHDAPLTPAMLKALQVKRTTTHTVLLAFNAGACRSQGDGSFGRRHAWDIAGRMPHDIPLQILVLAELGPWGNQWGGAYGMGYP